MESKMESFKQKGRLSRRFSSRKVGLGSLKTRFKKFLGDHQAKPEEAEDNSSSGSGSDTEGRKINSPIPQSGEIRKFSSSSSSDSDEASPSQPHKEEEKSDSSSDSSSSEKKRKRDPAKSSRKKLQLLLEKERQDPFRLPTLEETPPSSPQSNPRFSTGALSDIGRLGKFPSAPNSPANLAHNLNLNYRGGVSSPVALIHSLSAREPGKHANPLSEISFVSTPSSSSLDLDVLGGRDDMSASPSKATPSLKSSGLPIALHDEQQGVWRCGSCGWVYPNPNPSLRNRREHKKQCGELTSVHPSVQRWLQYEGPEDVPAKEALESRGDVEEWKGPHLEETLGTADEHPMENFDGHDGTPDRSTDHSATLDRPGENEIDSNESPEHHTFGDDGNDGKNSTAVENPDKVEDQQTVESEIKDESSSSISKEPSNGSTKLQGMEESKLEDVSHESITAHDGIEKTAALDDSADNEFVFVDNSVEAPKMTPEADNDKDERVEKDTELEDKVLDGGSQQQFESEEKAHESELSENPEEEVENEIGDSQMQAVNGNEMSGQHTSADINSNGHDLWQDDNTAGLNEEEDSANQDVSKPGETGLPDIPQIHSDRSVLPSGNGMENEQGTDELERDDLNNHTPTDDGSSKESLTVEEVEKEAPRILTDNDQPNYKERVVKAFEATQPSFATPSVEDGKVDTDNSDNRVPDSDNKIDEMEPQAEQSSSQNGHEVTEGEVKYNGFEFPDDTSEPRVTEIDDEERNSGEESSAQESGSQTESPSPMEEAPKWVTSVMLHPQEEKDTFTTRQKYWADMTRSEFLLVEGKRSPSFGKGEDPAFPFFRIGEGRRSPSPFSLGKSEQEDLQSSSPSPISISKFEEGETQSSSPSPLSLSKPEKAEIHISSPFPILLSKAEGGQIRSSSPSPLSLGKSEEGEIQRTPSSLLSKSEESLSPLPVAVNKSEQGEIQSLSPLVLASYQNPEEDKAISNGARIQHEESSSSSEHVDYDFAHEVHRQITHDMICPVCGSDVTKRIILKKRKRTLVPEDDGRLPKAVMPQRGGPDQPQELQTGESEDEAWGCLSCFSFFRRSNERATKTVVTGPDGELIQTEKEEVRCLPLPFSWRLWTSDPELHEPLLPNAATEEPRAPTDAEDAEEKRSWNCLPAFSWGPIPVSDVQFPLDEDESPGIPSSDHKNISGVKGKEEATAGSSDGEISQPIPEGAGRVDEVPLDDDEQVNCFSYLHHSKTQLLADFKRQKDVAEVPKPAPVMIGTHEVPLDDHEQVSCFSYLGSVNQYPKGSSVGAVQKIDGTSVGGEATGEPSTPQLEANIGEKAPEILNQAEEGGVPDKEQPSIIQRGDAVGVSQPAANNATRVSEEEEKCECLPFFSFISENSYRVHRVTDSPAPTKGSVEADPGSSYPSTISESHPVDDPHQGSDFLPASVPASALGSSSKYELPPAPGGPPSKRQITNPIEIHDEVTAGRSPPSVAREPQSLEDAEEKSGSSCLSELLPPFSWGPVPVYDVEYSEFPDNSSRVLYQDITNAQKQEAPEGSSTLTQEPQILEDAEERNNCNCLPDLLPTFSRAFPPYDPQHSVDSDRPQKAHLSDQDNNAVPGQQDAPASSSTIPLTREPQSLEDAEERSNCNCLPELRPAFHWGNIPAYDVQYSIDSNEFPGLFSSDQDKIIVVGQQGASAGSSTTSATPEPQMLEDTEARGNCNCLSELLPALSWGKVPVVDNTYLPPLISGDGSIDEAGSLPGTTGHIHKAPLGDDQFPDLRGKRVVNEGGSSAGIPVEKTDPIVGPELNLHRPPAHLEAESKEDKTCLCLPLVLPAIHWGWTKTTKYESELQKPLIDPRPEKGFEPPAADPVPVEQPSSSLIDSRQPRGLQEPKLPPRSEKDFEPPAAEPVPVEQPSSSLIDPRQTTETPPYSAPKGTKQLTSTRPDFNEGSSTEGYEEYHIEGIAGHKTVTKRDPTDQSTEITDPSNVHESNYHFDVNIINGHFLSTVQRLPPGPHELEISNIEEDPSTVADPSDSSAYTGNEPEPVHPHGDLSGTVAGVPKDALGEHLANAIAAHRDQENLVASAGAVPKPIKNILSQVFPATDDEREARGTLEGTSKHEDDSCSCLPVSVKTIRWWRPSMDYRGGEGLEERLLDRVEDKDDSGVQTGRPPVSEPAAGRLESSEQRIGKQCNCLPFSLYDVFREHHIAPEQPLPGTEVDDIRDPLLGTRRPRTETGLNSNQEIDQTGTSITGTGTARLGTRPPKTETIVDIHQQIGQTETDVTVRGPTTEDAASEAIAIALGRSPSAGTSHAYLKSIVHGGLDVTLVSLGVVSSGCGGDAKTITVIAIGLANLVFGVITHFGTVMSLYYNNRPKFEEEVGQGFAHGCLSLISFLFFGALAPITYGVSFRHASSTDYKFAATCVVALVCIVLLGAAKARVKSSSAIRVISILICTGFLAAIAGYETGESLVKLFRYAGFDSV